MDLSLKTEQKQALSQKMIQSAEILQMSSAELDAYLNAQSLENPVLELREASPPIETAKAADKALEKQQWISAHDEQNRYLYQKTASLDEDEFPEWNMDLSQPESLYEHLWGQLLTLSWPRALEPALQFFLKSLDHKGYFTDSEEEFAAQFCLSAEETARIIALVQELEPAGVGARSLEECLKLQLKRKNALTPQLERLIDQYLPSLAKNRLPAIAKDMKLPLETVKAFCETVRTLNPKPAAYFSDVRQIHYAVPDVIIVKFREHFDLFLNESLYPDIQFNADYVRMAKEEPDGEVRRYLNDRLRGAEWLRQCVSQRNARLLSVAGNILKRQQGFFQYGPGALLPLRLSDTAEDLGIHVSTVSRAVRQKYLQCSYGIFPLSYFFQKASPSSDSPKKPSSRQGEASPESCRKGSADATMQDVKNLLRKLISQENGEKPFSDRVLAELLSEQGFSISRRTVAKYREAEQIPAAAERRKY